MQNQISSIEVILSDDIRKALDDFAALLNLRAVFFSRDGREIKIGRNAEASAYCRIMWRDHGLAGVCDELDWRMQAECGRKKQILSYVCHAGLGEIVAPVIVMDDVVGFIVLGQFRVTPRFPAIAASPEEKRLYAQLPLFTREQLLNLEHMLQVMLEWILAKKLVDYPQDMRIVKLHRYIECHLAEKITLASAAHALCCSVSTLTHFLREKGNSCFSRIVMSKRIERAKILLKEHPDWKLDTVAEKSGFGSSFYFSRMFKKAVGVTPKDFRCK